jgi:hypothetical protein
MSYNFNATKAKGNRWGVGAGPDGLKNPLVKLGSYCVCIPASVYKELGSPEYLVAAVDNKNKAFKLITASKGTGYHVRKTVLSGGASYWTVFNLNSGKTSRSDIMGDLPNGWYRPIGGGVFEHDRPLANHRQGM